MLSSRQFLNREMRYLGFSLLILFASIGLGAAGYHYWALFSGISFLTFVAVPFAPIYHRFLHTFHLSIGDDDDGGTE